MTNTALLLAAIEKSGYKNGYIAEQCGLTRQGFLNKVYNKTAFVACEIAKLQTLLCLSKKEVWQIFFADDVPKTGTKGKEND